MLSHGGFEPVHGQMGTSRQSLFRNNQDPIGLQSQGGRSCRGVMAQTVSSSCSAQLSCSLPLFVHLLQINEQLTSKGVQGRKKQKHEKALNASKS